jgi:hypothetical protein
MTEASRVQKMLNEQNVWIDKLKSQVMRLELDVVGYRTKNKQLESALHQWDDLIVQQFTGSRAAMSAMTEAAQITAALLHEEAPWPETRIEKLEAALAHIYAWYPISVSDPLQTIKEISIYARKALEGKRHD